MPAVVEVEIPPSQAELEYLDDIAAAYLAAPEYSEEEELLGRAHGLACSRLNVDENKHMEEATALGAVAEERAPFVVRLAGAVASALDPRVGAPWLSEEPWRDVDVPGEEYVAAQAIHAVAEAYARLGDASDQHWPEVLSRQVMACCIQDGVDPTAFDVAELDRRLVSALRSARS